MPKNTFFTKPVFFPVLCLCLFLLLPLSVSADGAGTPAVSTSSVTLYGLDSYYEEYLEIPEGYPQSFRLEVTDAEQVSYRVSSGDSVTVSEDGVIAPRYTTWYWKNGIGSSFTAPPEDLSGYTITREGHYGDSVVTVTADGRTFDVSVAVLSYSAVYAESVMREHLDTHVTPGMTPLEKLRVICEFVAGYDYYYGFSGAEGMIASGKGGDCWASTDAVIRMAGMLGMRAWSRNGNKDSGAGNGHMNAMIEAEGRYYLADAGYAGTAPRFYSLRERTSLFSYCTYTGGDAEGVEVYQYDGIDVPESFRIPDSVDGSPVVSVGNLFARGSRMEGVKTLTLPDTVVHIGENAFYSMDSMEHISLGSGLRTLGSFAFSCCSALEEVCLPASLTSMGNNPFLCCSSLRTIIAEGADPAYTFKNDLLTTSDGTRLVCCLPSLSGELTVPEGVTVIGGQAFYETAITSVSLPDSLTALEDSVFLYCSSLTEVVIPGNVTSVGINALYSGSLNKVVFVSSACALADFLNAFFPGAEVYCRPDSPVASVCAENGYQT
ncbi:MAG: leucine-rich repeat domain-containing protein, partial [Lachnospiraceae bacterium]|nr:leucine-rich repeat domain-containing protein [Lachnospiraceae bacterium]